MNITTDHLTWAQATANLRKQLFADAYPIALEEIEKERKDKPTTETQRIKARNRARGVVTSTLYKMAEYDGIANPIHSDEIWGPNAKPETKATTKTVGDEAEVIAFLKKNDWSDFAKSLHTQYGERGTLSPKQWASARKMKATMAAKEAATKAQPEPPINHNRPSTLDLTELPSGYYAVPGGDTRLKVRVARPTTKSRWHGWTFVSDGAEYGQRTNYGKQAPSGKYQGKIQDELRSIIADPKAAMSAYGRLTGTCGRCGRILEDEQSIKNGIGPVCINLF